MTIHNLLKLKLVEKIWIFLYFRNFYELFIKSFRKIVILLSTILKIIISYSNNNNSGKRID